MTEFKVGDKVIIKSDAVSSSIPVGAVAIVADVDNQDDYDPFIYKVRYGTKYAWATPADIAAYVPECQDETAYYGSPEIKEATPIDLPTVKFIYEQWANILGAEGITDEAAADIFGGYLSGLMQGLKGDFDA